MSFIISNYFWWLNDMENPKAITYEHVMFADFDTKLGKYLWQASFVSPSFLAGLFVGNLAAEFTEYSN